MPPLPKIESRALADLEAQLRFAPPDALRRDADRAEALVAEIDPGARYPADWVVFRVTGYRPDRAALDPEPGHRLIADISALVEHLSDAAGYSLPELRAAAGLTADELARRWGVSRKTVDRYRRLGLVARRVRADAGRRVLAFTGAAVERFERSHARRLAHAARFSRLDPRDEARALRRAARYRRRFHCSLNEAALRIARRLGRAHETIRQLLRRHDAHAERPIFAEPGPISDRSARAAWRAWRRALDPAELAQRFHKSRATVLRVINEQRADALRRLALPCPDTPAVTGALRRGDLPLPARSGLGAPGATDLLAFILDARAPRVPVGFEETVRARACRELVSSAARRIAGLPPHAPRATVLDEIETDLRWAARLKAELLRAELPVILRAAEDRLARPLDRMRRDHARSIVLACLAAAAAAADAFDPRKGGRLAAPVGLAVTAAVARWIRDHPDAAAGPASARAAPRLQPGTTIDDWTRAVCPWQSFLEPDPRLRAVIHRVEPRLRLVLEHRFGWAGSPPVTLRELPAALSEPRLTLVQAVRLERLAIRAALALARAGA